MENTPTTPEKYFNDLTTKFPFEISDENITGIKSTAKFNHDIGILVTSPYWEKIIFLLYGLFILIFGTTANSLVLYLTARHQKFHEAYMYIRTAYAVVYIFFAWGTVPIVLVNLLYEDLIPPWISCYISDIGVGMFHCTMHLTAFIALERYAYFCHPLKYHLYFNLKTITVTCTSMIILTQAYMIGTEIVYGRTMQFVALMCQLREPIHIVFQLAVWYIPSVFIVIFSIVSIQRMVLSMANSQVLPAGQNTMEPQLRKRASRKAIR